MNEPGPPPGYTGHLSRGHEHFGASYGRTSRQIAEDPEARKSKRGICMPVHSGSYRRAETARQVEAEYSHATSYQSAARQTFSAIQERRVGHPLKSGYTGFVPRMSNHHFGETFGVASYRALAEHTVVEAEGALEHELLAAYANSRTATPARSASPSGTSDGRPSAQPYAATSLAYKPIAPGALALSSSAHGETAAREPELDSLGYGALRGERGTTFDMHAMTSSVYALPSGHPKRYFVPCYAGHVPHAATIIGRNYPDTTRLALDSFSAEADAREADRETRAVGLAATIRQNYHSGGQARAMPAADSPRVRPVAGATVHLPGSVRAIGLTYGRLTETVCEQGRRL